MTNEEFNAMPPEDQASIVQSMRSGGKGVSISGLRDGATSFGDVTTGSVKPEGMDLDAIGDFGASLGRGAISSGVASVADNISGGLPGLGALAGSLTSESMKSNPSYGRAAIGSSLASAASLIGNIAAPGLGMVVGPIASYMAKMSYDDGLIGDAFDARDMEDKRDAVESGWGVGTGTTKGLASTQRSMDSLGMGDYGTDTGFGTGGYSFGLDSAFDSTPTGQLASLADGVFGSTDPFGGDGDDGGDSGDGSTGRAGGPDSDAGSVGF